MKWILALLTIFSLTTCSRIGPLKSMTLKGTAVKTAKTQTAVGGGRVSLVVPGPSGWKRVVFDQSTEIPNIVTTAADGTFTFKVQFNWWEEVFAKEDRPVFVAVSDANETFTLLSQIPNDTSKADAELTVNPSPQTTVAALWQCPTGKFASPTPSCPANVVCASAGGAPCYQVAEQSTTGTDVVNTIGIAAQSVPEADPTDWAGYSKALLNSSPALIAKIKAMLAKKGYSLQVEITGDYFSGQITSTKLPTIPIPTATDLNKPPATGGSSAAQCTSFMSCTKCSISACSDGTTSYYKTSGGGVYNCASPSNCTGAANQVVAACCSRDERSADDVLSLFGR